MLLLAGSLVVSWVLLVLWTIYAITHPPRRNYTTALSQGRPGDPGELAPTPRPFSFWTFESAGLRLPVWEIPGDDPQGPVIVLTHGWRDSRIGALSRVPWLVPIASSIIAWDMRGSGDAPGACSLGLREADDLAALCAKLGPDVRLVLHGWSMGAGVSMVAATRVPNVVAVIAESPYRLAVTPAKRMMLRMGMPWRSNLHPALAAIGWWNGGGIGWNRPQPFDRAGWAAQLRCPLLVVHGENDEISPIEDGRAIAAAGRGEFEMISGGGHHGLWNNEVSAPACAECIANFISRSKVPADR